METRNRKALSLPAPFPDELAAEAFTKARTVKRRDLSWPTRRRMRELVTARPDSVDAHGELHGGAPAAQGPSAVF